MIMKDLKKAFTAVVIVVLIIVVYLFIRDCYIDEYKRNCNRKLDLITYHLEKAAESYDTAISYNVYKALDRAKKDIKASNSKKNMDAIVRYYNNISDNTLEGYRVASEKELKFKYYKCW